MNFKHRGHTVKLSDKWKALSIKEKAGLIKDLVVDEWDYKKERFHDYWVGYVNVRTNTISCTNDKTGESQKKIYDITIHCGRNGTGQSFSHIKKDIAEELVKKWEFSDKKAFELHIDIDMGISAFQEYTFTRKQKDMLIEQLKPLLEKEWYDGEEDD